MGGAGHVDPQIFDRLRFSALASQAPFIRRLPIYAGVGRTSVRKGNVCQFPDPRNSQSLEIHGLAQSRVCFPTGNEPIFRYRRPGLQSESGAQFARIQTGANSQYAIQKTGANSGPSHADDGGARRDPVLALARSATKNQETKPFLTLGANSQKYSAMPTCNALAWAARIRTQPRKPRCARFRATRPSRLILTLMSWGEPTLRRSRLAPIEIAEMPGSNICSSPAFTHSVLFVAEEHCG